MGQQQLFMILVVAIIVSLAILLAVSIFGKSAKNSNRDMVRQDIFTIAAEAQGWYIKPQVLKGGGNTFKNVTFNKIGFGYDSLISNTDVVNDNGEYKMEVTDSVITITAIPLQDKENTIVAKIKRAALTFVNQSGTQTNNAANEKDQGSLKNND